MTTEVKTTELTTADIRESRRKNRTSLGERGDRYRDTLRKDTVYKNNRVEINNFDDHYRKAIEDEGIEYDTLGRIADVNRDFGLAAKDVIGEAMFDAMLDNDDVSLMEWRGSTPLAEFGVAVTRPTVKKAKRSHWRNGTTFYTGVVEHDSTMAILDELADMYGDK